MRNRYLVSPFFLDRHEPRLERVAASGWGVNRPALRQEGAQMARMSAVHEDLATWVEGRAREGERAVALVGDCCHAIGMLAGLQRARIDPVVVWLDAHGDFNTDETTISGFLGGMPLAMIAGRGDQTLLHHVRLDPVDESDIFLADARDLDPGERELLGKTWVRRPPIAGLAASLPADRPIYVHFDVDVLDTSYAPAMRYPVPGGPSRGEVDALVQALVETGRLVAVSMAAWNLETDEDRRTENVCLEMLTRITSS